MPVFRKKHTRDYTIIPNTVLRDQNLSLRDIGLLSVMLSKPKDWKFSYDALSKECQQDGRAALKASVKRLQKAGYLTIERKRLKGKIGESLWCIYDAPHVENQHVAKANTEEADTQPHVEKPHVENRHVLQSTYEQRGATPAIEGGTQPQSRFYKDAETGKWRDRENLWEQK